MSDNAISLDVFEYDKIVKTLWSQTIGGSLTVKMLLEKIVELLNAKNADIYFWDNNNTYYNIGYLGGHENIVRELINSSYSIKVIKNICYCIFYSSITKEKTGVLVLECYDTLTVEQAEELARLSQHVGLLIEKINESEMLLNQVKSLYTIAEIDSVFSLDDNFETNLGNIMEKIKHVFNASIGGVMLYNQKDNTLVLQKPGFGADDNIIEAYKVPLSKPSNAANVFNTGIPLISNMCVGDSRILQKYVQLLNVNNLLTVPLKAQGKKIGILHLANKREGLWTDNDLNLLQMMAVYLGNAIERAYLLEQLKRNHQEIKDLYNEKKQIAEELSKQKQIIDRQHSTLEWIFSIHNEILQSLIDKGGIREITAILSERIQKSVIIVNNYSQVVEMSLANGEHKYVVEKHIENRRINFNKTVSITCSNKKLFITPFLVDLKGYNMNNFSLIVLAEKYLDPHEINVIRQASIVFALEVLRQQNIVDIEKKIKADFLEDLLFSKNINKETFLTRAAYLNHNFNSPNILLVLDIDNFSLLIEREQLQEDHVFSIKKRLAVIAENNIKKHFPGNSYLIAGKSDTVLILLNFLHNNQMKELDTLADAIRYEVSNSLKLITVSVGISNVCNKIGEYRENYLDTKKALDVNLCLGKVNSNVFQNQLGINDLYFDLFNQEKFRVFSSAFLSPLLEYSKNKRPDLLQTVEVYLQKLNFHHTAAELYSHVNTIRYRIRKVEELLSIDFNSEEDRSKLSLALNIYKFSIKDSLAYQKSMKKYTKSIT